MRKISFRGKELWNGDWIYGGLFYVGKRAFIVFDDVELEEQSKITGFIEVDPITVGQFIKNENDKKIYEGDIVQSEGILTRYQVSYDETNAGWYPFISLRMSGYLTMRFEVIGNIYDNKNLLETIKPKIKPRSCFARNYGSFLENKRDMKKFGEGNDETHARR